MRPLIGEHLADQRWPPLRRLRLAADVKEQLDV
jgi:hypothetical protein